MEVGLKKVKEELWKEVKELCKSEISNSTVELRRDVPTQDSSTSCSTQRDTHIDLLEKTLMRLEKDLEYLKRENSSKQNTIDLLLENLFNRDKGVSQVQHFNTEKQILSENFETPRELPKLKVLINIL